MIVPLYPPLDGTPAERFTVFLQKLSQAQIAGDRSAMASLAEREIAFCQDVAFMGDQKLIYEACIRVVSDLVRLRWTIVEQGYGFALENRRDVIAGRPTSELVAGKKIIREELRPLVSEQLQSPSVQEFIRRMEDGSKTKKSIKLLLADSEELARRLEPARSADAVERGNLLRNAIQPYLQHVTDQIDPFTGQTLREIWRYFRYTWSIPQVAVPGRQMLYLVRDRAHPQHAVIGIASLNNCPLEMGEAREAFIGWHRKSIVARLLEAAERGKSALELEVKWLEDRIRTSLSEVDWTNLVTPEQVENPDAELIRGLLKKGQDFAKRREEVLRLVAQGDGEEFEPELWDFAGAPPVDDDILRIEAKASADSRMHAARKQLIAKKRANALGRLLQARLTIASCRTDLIDPARVLEAINRDDVKSAINITLDALKGRRSGANLLEITTCGAVAPYSGILGGKLVAMLMLSPEIGADYKFVYNAPSIISSQMRNQPVVRNNSLVYLGTTSLYMHGSSQYNRLKIPAGTIAPDQQEIRYLPIGQTSGFGTLQFSPETSRSIDLLLSTQKAFKDVNSVFGEGTSPKLRKIKAGLKILGFDADRLMQHRQHRLIYAAPLFPAARDWLMERSEELPHYLASPDQHRDATESIAEYWRSRWLASRLDYEPAMRAIATDRFRYLSEASDEETGSEQFNGKRQSCG
jgi:hypothetical protein